LILVTTEEVSCDVVRDTLTVAGLPNLWIPKTILRVECIPMLGTGKVDFKTCRELALNACVGKVPEIATASNPATPLR